MKCHGSHNNNEDNQVKKDKSHISHMIMMALCCGAPLLILLLVPFLIKVGGSSIAGPLSAIAPYLCPIMMVFMIPMMLKGHKGQKED